MDLNFNGIFIIVKNEKKVKYERFIVLSEKFIYKLSSLNISTFQWALSIESIYSIKISKSDSRYINLSVKSSINKKIVNERKFPLKNKDDFEFSLKFKTDVHDLIFLLRKCIFNLTKTFVKVTY